MKFYDSPLFSCLLLGEQSMEGVNPFHSPKQRIKESREQLNTALNG